MARRIAHRVAGTGRPGPDELLRSGLEVLNVGIAVFDRDLTLVACNEAFGELRGYPAALCRPGTAMAELLRFNAERGDYGPGDVEKHVRSRLQRVRKFEPHELEYQLATGRILNIRYHPIGGDGLLLSFYDMTETRRAEAALRESEARYALVEQAATEGIYEWLIDKSELHASPRMKQLFGFSAGKVDSRNWGWNARVHPDDFERYKAALRDHFKGRSETYECEYRVRDESGHYRWILDRGVCVRNENGRAVRLVGAISDVTEHVRRETELAEKTAILESTLENMDQGISMVDGELKVIAFNRRFLELLDFPAERFKRGYHMAEAFRYNAERGEYGPGDVETLVQERIELAKRFESHHFERTRPDGTVIEIHGRPLPNKGGFVTTYTDITARKMAEQKLLAAQEDAERARRQLVDAIEAISEGIVLFDQEDRVILCNSNYRRYFADAAGEDVANMVQPGALFWDFLRAAHGRGMLPNIAPDEIAAYIKKRKKMRRNPSGSVEQHLRDGRWLQISERKTADGGIASVYTDITKLKQREVELDEKTAELEALSSKLSKYLSPQVYSSIFSGAQSVEIASKRKKLTVFFSDIAGFTETTDSLESEELTGLLNQYLTEMSKIALEHGATIDKFVGDAIMLFFGDPDSKGVKGDAAACVAMAIAMQRRMAELQSEWRDRGVEEPFRLRIGINTGYCTVGNFGSEDRMDYTIVGNEVNLAARLQSHADLGGILLANETHSLVKDIVLAEEGEALTVKGFAKPVRTYRVVGLTDDLAEEGRVIRRNADGLTLVIDRERLTPKAKAKAIVALEEALQELKNSKATGRRKARKTTPRPR